MGKNYVYIILFIVAILGLSVVQYQYFRIGLNLAGTQFNQKMGEVSKEITDELRDKNELTFLLGSVLSENDSNFRLSSDSLKDASVYFMNDFLKEKLMKEGIKADYSFTIYDKDSLTYLTSDLIFKEADMLFRYPVRLEGYLPDLLGKRLSLELQFKNVNRYFLSQLNGLTIPTVIFMIIIILVILWVYRAFYLQDNLIMTTNEFINNLTHELKTPIFSIGVATKILEEKGHADNEKIAKILRSQVEKLKNQIEKVLELGIIEGKKKFIVKKKIDVAPLLNKISKEFSLLAELSNFQFSSNIKGDDFIVMGDLYHLENTINSLLDNALKYSPDEPEIRLEAYKSDKNLVVEIVDNGIGIGTDEIKNIFNKYYRISQGDLHTVKGFGLGLNYVERIVHLHKGKIKVKSKIKEGSTFSLNIPLVKNGG